MTKCRKMTKMVVDRILAMIRSDTYTITEICKNVGINRRTFYNWMNQDEEFAEKVADAQAELLERLSAEAKKSLMKKVTGYDVVETKVVTVPGKEIDEKGTPKPIIKEQTSTKKHIPADTTAIIFTLTNREPDVWKNRQTREITGKDGKDLFADKTDEELDKEIKELERKLK